MNARGRLTTDGRRSMNRESLAVLSLQGTLAGAQFGGKAAGIGAGAGAAIAAVLMMSQRGRDVSVSAGTPFSVRLQQDADLPAPAVFWAQQDYASSHPNPTAYEDWDDGFDSGPRPVLKRRDDNLRNPDRISKPSLRGDLYGSTVPVPPHLSCDAGRLAPERVLQ